MPWRKIQRLKQRNEDLCLFITMAIIGVAAVVGFTVMMMVAL